MNNTTLIIDNNSVSRNRLFNFINLKMPNLNLIAKTGDANDGIALIKTQKPQLVFVNIEYLTASHFMQLKEMKNSSLVFITSGFVEEQLNKISNNLFNESKKDQPSIELKIDNLTQKIPLNEVIRIEASANYSLIYKTSSIKPILVAKPLKHLINSIDNPYFIRPHQSHYINKNFIEAFSKGKNPYLLLKDKTKIDIARRRLKEIKDRIF